MSRKIYCMQLGGHDNADSQWMDREATPMLAARKVPVPWGRKCPRKTVKPSSFRLLLLSCRFEPRACTVRSSADIPRALFVLKCQRNGAHSSVAAPQKAKFVQIAL